MIEPSTTPNPQPPPPSVITHTKSHLCSRTKPSGILQYKFPNLFPLPCPLPYSMRRCLHSSLTTVDTKRCDVWQPSSGVSYEIYRCLSFFFRPETMTDDTTLSFGHRQTKSVAKKNSGLSMVTFATECRLRPAGNYTGVPDG